MTATVRSFLFVLSLFLCVGLTACGDDDDDDDNGGGGGGSSSVSVEQLAGTWFGTFDDTSSIRTFEFRVDGSNIVDIKLNGTAVTLTGVITKATETARGFRFTINDSGGEVTRGVWSVDANASHLAYIDREFNFGVLQKGTPAPLPTFAQADINRTWNGLRTTTVTDFTTLSESSVSGPCTAVNPASSTCAFALSGGVTRTFNTVVMDDPAGRWLGSYEDAPPPGTPPALPTARLYLSPDKNFAAGWTCAVLNGNPFDCEIYSLSGS